MVYTLTIESDTPAGLLQATQDLVEALTAGSTAAPGAPEPSEHPPDAPAALTNDDYRHVIGSIPVGKVASYSTVSSVVRGDNAGSQKVAGLAANDSSLTTAYRVVKKDGTIAAGFRWADGRMGAAHEARERLEQEGVRFDLAGRVLPDFMLSAEELAALSENGRSATA